MNAAPQLLTTREAAEALRISRGRVAEVLTPVFIKGRRGPRFDVADIQKLIRAGKGGGR